MGYTHYWRAKNGGEIPAAEWSKIVEDAKALITACETRDIRLAKDENSDEPPEITDDVIYLNGTPEPNGHEPFFLQRELESFQFCKTAYKPYDVVVVAVLASAGEHASDFITISSDGDESDWQDGLTWASEVLGGPLAFPIKNDETA